MAGKTAFFSRLQVLLELVGTKNFASIDSLAQSIMRQSPPNFVYRRWNVEKEEYVGECSERAVRKTLDIAIDLGLLDGETGARTAYGNEAADPARYPVVLRRRVRAKLRQVGCSQEELDEASKRMLRSRSPILPTAHELYVETCLSKRIELAEVEFRKLLMLLADSGGMQLSRSYIYYPTFR